MIKKGLLTGLLLFGIFFGAGNLIFPPSLGALSGENFWPAILGFVISGVGLAIFTLIIGAINPKGYIVEITQKTSRGFALTYLIALLLAIGPFFAIPRTATTSFSVGFEPVLPENFPSALALFIFTSIYFVFAYVLALKPSNILTSIGRILTPIFALSIILLIILGIFQFRSNTPMQVTSDFANGNAFGAGFIEGYNTLDALASVAFSSVAVSTLYQLGFKNKKEYLTTIWVVGAIVAIAFSVLYIGLAYLGNHFPVPTEVIQSGTNIGVYVLSRSTQAIFGSTAQYFLALMITMTCFTTAVGLIVSVSNFFAKEFPQFSYTVYVTIFTIISFTISNLGLSTIIAFSLPALLILYPITITLVIIITLNKKITLSKTGLQLTVGLVTIVSILDVLAPVFQWHTVQQIISFLPLSNQSLAWALPAMMGIVLSALLPINKIKGESFDFHS